MSKKIFIAVTSYTGMIEVGNCSALINNVLCLEKEGYEVTLHFEVGNCYIAQARNMCVSLFLETNCDYLLFVDSDLHFDKDAVLKMVKREKNIICGAYPFKTGEYGFPIKVNCNKDQTPIVEDGLLSISGGATGLMLIKRNVLETLIAKNKKWKTNHKTTTLGTNLYAIFDTGLLKGNGNWYGEDYLFCMRAIDHGFNIYCEPNINFEHIGKVFVKGNYHEYLLKQPQPTLNKDEK